MSFKKPNENTKTRPIQTTGTEKEIESKTRYEENWAKKLSSRP